ncbi:MAG: HEAT repeat domain-containing protein [Chloracidobacterium sp.]|nr:HEAT repeat domain-containing protein [Chloracidobacterium sp.]
MITLETWRSIIEVLGWTLIHFTWQGTLVALSLAGVMRILRGASTKTLYAAACVALLLMSSLPLFTITIICLSTPGKAGSAPPPQVVARPASLPQPVEIEQSLVPNQTAMAPASPRPWLFIRPVSVTQLLPWMSLFWLLGVVFFSIRLVGGWLYTRRLRSYGTRPLEEGWEQIFLRLCGRLRAPRPARLLQSALVKVPMVIGWLRPVILLPAGALTGLTTRQLEAIIAHELAHIRRHDYLINLLQAVVETLLFYHPAVWWVSRKIRQEREHCCDDMAVAVCGDAVTYSRALLEMEQLHAAGSQLAMASNGGLLMNRIQRLLSAQPKHDNRFSGLFAGVIALITLISAGAGAQIMLKSSSRHDLDVVSVRKREAMKVSAAAETPGESNGAGQQTGSVQDDSSAESLLPNLQSASWEVRKTAVDRLAQIRGARADELLIAALKDEDARVRKQAVIGLGVREDKRLVWPLIAALTDHDWQAREQAAIALGKIDYESAVESPLKALLDSEWAVREQAAQAMELVGQERAVELLINALQDRHEQVREAAAKSLGIIGDRRAMEPLIQALQDADEQVRKKAIEALGLLKQSGGAGDSSISMNALGSSNAVERAIAACSLGRLGAVDAIPALISLLGDDTPIQPGKCWESGDWSPARLTFKQASPGEQAAIALASFSQPAVEPLIAALNNGNPSVRRNAAWAIGEIRGGLAMDRNAAVEPLIASLGDQDSWVRVAAAFSLGEMRPLRATESLIAALGDAEWRVRGMAARALGEMKARAALESLRSLSLHDENEQVRRKAAQALSEIGESPAKGAQGDLKFDGRFGGVTNTFEWNLTGREGSKTARLKINGQIKSGDSVWTLRDPNGTPVFTAESGNAELALDSGDLRVIPGEWTLQVELKNGTLDFEVLWSAR